MYSNKDKIDFSIFEKDNSSYVQMKKETPLGNSEKVILLEEFLQFVTDFNSDKNFTDTGFLVPKLVRKVTKGTRHLCFYHFPEITVSPYTNIRSGDEGIKELMSYFEKDNPPFSLKYDRNITVRHRGEEQIRHKLYYENLKLKNVMLVTFYDTSNDHIISYNVCHVLNQASLFQDSTSLLNDDTLLFPTLFPNHYSDKICWGSTNFESNLNTFFKNYDSDGIKSIPYIYFNSLFNDDLLSSVYSNGSHYKIKESLMDDIIKYYYDNFVSEKTNFNIFKAVFIKVLASDLSRSKEYTLRYTVSSLFFIIGPLCADSDLYSRYFSELNVRNMENAGRENVVRSISSYIKSRLSI